MRTLIATAALALVLAAPAQAKELVQAQICGAEGCATTTDRDELMLVPGGEAIGTPPPLAPYYEVRVTIAEGDDTSTWTSWYVPSADMVAFRDPDGTTAFHPIFGKSIPFMREWAQQVEPFAAPRITAAFVGGKRVAGDAATYAELFAAESAGPARPETYDWVPVELRSARPSPWTDGGVGLLYSPADGLLHRGPDLILLSDGLADDLAAVRALDAAGDGRQLMPWLAAAALLAAMLLVAALGARLRTRAPAPAPTSS